MDYLKRVEDFVKIFHKGEEAFERMIGVQAIVIQSDLRPTLFFNADSPMTFKEYLDYMGLYYADPTVKEYLKKTRISDYRKFKDKVAYVLISNHWVHLYYYIWAFFKSLKTKTHTA